MAIEFTTTGPRAAFADVVIGATEPFSCLAPQMVDFAHLLDRTLHSAEPFLIAVAVILWAIAFGTSAVQTWRQPLGTQPQRPIFFRAATGFLVIILSICAAAVFIGQAARDEVGPRLNASVAP